MRGRRDRLDVEDVAARVGDRLPEEGDGALIGQRRPGGRVARVVHEARLDAQARQGVGEQVRGAAVQGGGGHDVVARPAQRQEGEGLGGHARRRQQRPDAALQGRDPLLDDVIGGVVQARVDRAEVAQGEAGGRLLGRLEDVGGGLVDRDGPGVGGLGQGVVPSLDLLGLEAPARRAGGGGDRLRALGGGLGGGVLVGHEGSLVIPSDRRRCQRHERCLPRAGGCGAVVAAARGPLGPASEPARQQEGARRRGAESSAVTVAATSAMVRVRAGTRTWADGGVRVSCAFAPWWGCPAEGPQDDGTCSDFSGFLRRWSKRASAMRLR